MKIFVRTFIFIGVLFSSQSYAKPGPFGLGVVIGQPSGISARYDLGNNTAIDASLGWSLNSNGYVALSSTFLFEKPKFVRIDRIKLDLHYGVGVGMITSSAINNGFGIRVPIGLSYYFSNPDIQTFIELAALQTVSPATDFWLQAAIGARYYF